MPKERRGKEDVEIININLTCTRGNVLCEREMKERRTRKLLTLHC